MNTIVAVRAVCSSVVVIACVLPAKLLTKRSTSTTMMSCTIRKPIAIFPCSVSSSFLSVRSFTMIMVLLNVSATAMYMLAVIGSPKVRASMKPIALVKSTCPTPVYTLISPTFCRLLMSRLSPTMKSRSAIPSCPSTSRLGTALVTSRKLAPRSIPASM